MKKAFALLPASVIGMVLLLIACDRDSDSQPSPATRYIKSYGTIVHLQIEGGFYGIIAANGSRYNPVNMPDSLTRDSLPVYFEGEIQKDVATIQIWGEVIELSEIRTREHP